MAQHLKYYFTHKLSLFIGLVFTCNSLLFGSWITRIPDVKDSLGLSEAELGLALLGAPIGALMIMPISGWIIARLQMGRTVIFGSILHAASLPLLVVADSFWMLVGALVIFGYTNAIMDISMNAASAVIERKLKKPIMSTCHGMWSIGAMIGAGVGSLFVGYETAPLTHLTLVVAAIVVILITVSGALFGIRETRNLGDKVFAFPKGVLLLLAFLAFCILIGEGAIADWSAVYMKEVIQSDPFLTGIAYSGFALLMTVGRLSGDALIPKFGKQKLLFFGSLIASIGLAMAIIFQQQYVVIAGFSLAGLGFSCLVPVLFISAANVPGYTSGTGIAAVTTVGYAGFLVGPPFIGLLAEYYSLTVGLCFVLFSILLVSVLSLKIKFN